MMHDSTCHLLQLSANWVGVVQVQHGGDAALTQILVQVLTLTPLLVT
jgi:hypothetical protein